MQTLHKVIKEIDLFSYFGLNTSIYYVDNVAKSPITLQEVLSLHDVIFWKEVVNDEIKSLISNKAWSLIYLPLGCKIIGYRWVLRKELKLDGSMDKYKDRLVAKAFEQKTN